MKRGRQSAADRNVLSIGVPYRSPPLVPCRKLSKPERKIFDLIVRDHKHLRTFDAPLLTGYVIACAKMMTTKDPSDFDKLARVSMALATKLRLTPQSGMQPVQLGRRYQEPSPGRSFGV